MLSKSPFRTPVDVCWRLKSLVHKMNRCTSNVSASGVYNDLSPIQAYELLRSGVRYLDVRTEEEFVGGHAPKAINVPVKLKTDVGMASNVKFQSEVTDLFPNKTETIVVGCKAGARSVAAIQLLSLEGYENLHNVVGGWDAWSSNPNLPVEK